MFGQRIPSSQTKQKDDGNQREDETYQLSNNVVEDTLKLCDDINTILQESSKELRRWVLDDNLGDDG